MKNALKNRITHIARLPIAMLLPALIAGFAAVGQAQGIPQMIITAEKPANCETSVDLRDQMEATAKRAVWKTQARVDADLRVKLNSQSGWIRLAATDDRKRG